MKAETKGIIALFIMAIMCFLSGFVVGRLPISTKTMTGDLYQSGGKLYNLVPPYTIENRDCKSNRTKEKAP